MHDTPQEVQLALAEFDRTQLPESQRALQGDAFRQAVQQHLAAQFIGGQGAAEVVVTADRIIIRWTASTVAKTLTERGVDTLKQGDYDKGIATLRIALQRTPDDAETLFNLAMALSDRGQLDEAVALLQRLLAAHPAHNHGWVALGVAQARLKQDAAAIDSLQMAVAINQDDGYAHKNLGVILARAGSADEGIKHLRLAAALLPADQQAWYNLALALEKSGKLIEADEVYTRVLMLDAAGELGKLAEEGRSRIVAVNFRSRGANFRTDAFNFCLGALKRFAGMPKPEIQRITFEIALLGASGLSVNDPTESYTLKSIPGQFSGLHLLCIEYVGFQVIDPTVDLGFDLTAEYAEARRVHGSR